MSKNSGKQLYEASTEWLKWARTKYPSLKVKKKPSAPFPAYNEFNEY